MGGRHRKKYRHNKWIVINRNGLMVFWRTVYHFSRDLFKIQMGLVAFSELKYSNKKWFIL